MLIFDRFASRNHANNFVDWVASNHGLRCTIHDSQQSSNAVDPFPFMLDPPIVLVQRASLETEEAVEASVTLFGGVFAGT